ncbi:MAG TPA: hypothetical protein PLP17_10735 [Oligoflexia bacterium]|nr:hypothetical protein [Oligoflexia bacterium]
MDEHMTCAQSADFGPDEVRPAQPGKGLEHLKVSSGRVLIIDQFMLANDQFLSKLKGLDPGAATDSLGVVAEQYGGCVVETAPGAYLVYRDPHQAVIVLQRGDGTAGQGNEQVQEFDFAPVLDACARLEPAYHVFVDTRCLVFLDMELLFNKDVIDEYKTLRCRGKDKEARDFLRKSGAAVRYGFNRYGDELGVFQVPAENIIALWPDVVG